MLPPSGSRGQAVQDRASAQDEVHKSQPEAHKDPRISRASRAGRDNASGWEQRSYNTLFPNGIQPLRIAQPRCSRVQTARKAALGSEEAMKLLSAGDLLPWGGRAAGGPARPGLLTCLGSCSFAQLQNLPHLYLFVRMNRQEKQAPARDFTTYARAHTRTLTGTRTHTHACTHERLLRMSSGNLCETMRDHGAAPAPGLWVAASTAWSAGWGVRSGKRLSCDWDPNFLLVGGPVRVSKSS